MTVTSNLLKLQEEASVWKVVVVCAICILNAASHGFAIGFMPQGLIMYRSPNATSYFSESLDTDQLSWLSKYCLKII